MAKILTDNGKILTTSDGRAIASVATDEFVPIPGKWYRHILNLQLCEIPTGAFDDQGNEIMISPDCTYEIINSNPVSISLDDVKTHFTKLLQWDPSAEVPEINIYLKSRKPLWISVTTRGGNSDTVNKTIYYEDPTYSIITFTSTNTNDLITSIKFEFIEPLN